MSRRNQQEPHAHETCINVFFGLFGRETLMNQAR